LLYRTLGGTGIEVSVQCLGTMMFGADGNPDHGDCVRITHAALDSGINFVDTADAYSDGESEVILGNALRDRRDQVVLATKGHFQMGEGRNRSGNSRRWLIQAVDDSLRRLQTDWIDLYQVHRPDESTDIEETLAALTDLVQAGKIRAFGSSSFPPELIVEAHFTSLTRGLGRFRTEQPPYSLLARGAERSVFATCKRLAMGVLTWSPLAWGWLSGRFRRGAAFDFSSGRPALRPAWFDLDVPENAAKLDAVEAFAEIADSHDLTLPELALAFPTVHPAVTSVIIGPRTMAQLEACLKSASIHLDDETLDRIDAVVAPGRDLYHVDPAWTPRSLWDPLKRRRPLLERRGENAIQPPPP
jgi:aryl-alcohol dehydrogenase-like predicted oxidoreductase